MPKAKREVILTIDSQVIVREKDESSFLDKAAPDLEVMRKRLEIRARAAAMLEVCTYMLRTGPYMIALSEGS